MTRFERSLLYAVLLLLVCIGGIWQWRLARPVFERVPVTDEDFILHSANGANFSKYQIGAKAVKSIYYECWTDHYQQGELMESKPAGSGRFDIDGRQRYAFVYAGYGVDHSHTSSQPTLYLGTDGWLHSTPVKTEEVGNRFFSPERVRLVLDAPTAFGAMIHSEQLLAPDQVFDSHGNLQDQALQCEEVYVLRMRFSQTEPPR